MKVKIRKGDTVQIISGRLEDKGKKGEVIKVLPEDKNFEIIGFVGIAKKFNEICRLAAQNSADDVVTFDQDSLPNDGFVSGSSKEVLQVFQTGCWWVKKIHLINREHSVTSARMLLSSGILLKIAAWDE